MPPRHAGVVADPRPPKLPQLQPHVNKRAQQIIAAHMNSNDSSTTVLATTVKDPVLMLLDKTAPRTSRTHDISHLCDQVAYLTPSIAPTLIPESDHIYDASFMPVDPTSTYNDDDGMWHTKVFPSSAPSSRGDAQKLNDWIHRSLEEYQETSACAAKEDLARAVEDLVPILSVALHEIVRQVAHHCVERGSVLEKIWRTYVELFNRVLCQMQESLRAQKRKTSEAQTVLTTARDDLQSLRKSHPEQMHSVIAELEVKFTKRQQSYEEDLRLADNENHKLKQELRSLHNELELWCPSFFLYQDSYIKGHIPQYSRSNQPRATRVGRTASKRATSNSAAFDVEGARPDTADSGGGQVGRVDGVQEEQDIPPELAIAEDFKRLLAILAPEKRRMIGKELAGLMEMSDSLVEKKGMEKKGKKRLSALAREEELQREDTQHVETLQAEIRTQETRIKELKNAIAKLEPRDKHAA